MRPERTKHRTMTPRRLRRAAAALVMRCGTRGALAVALLLAMMVYVVAEDLTVVTSYSSPRGVYGTAVVTNNLGVGTMAPTANFHLTGTMRFTNGTEAPLRILTSDAAGNATWTDYEVPPGMIGMFNGGCPAAWVQFGALDGRVPRGAGAPGGTGGGNHTHTLNHDHGWEDPGGAWYPTDVAGLHGHLYTILDHLHAGGIGTGGGATNNMGKQCDNSGCFNPAAGHTHNFAIWTSGPANSGADPTLNEGDHQHNAWVDLPGWGTGGANPNTTSPEAGPPYRDIVFCQKT